MRDDPRIPRARARRIRERLLAWYRESRRDLPWRRTSDPYAIWVSEVMLQQTRVEAVLPYFERFLDRFPDLETLARSEDDEVLARWSGLGYYRRAKMLRRGAEEVVRRHGGRVPDDVDALRALPGVGRYTAGAIASVAFGRQEPVVDGNVERVLSRWLALDAPPGASRARLLWRVAEDLVRGESPGEWNQAVMELGATLCTPRAPRCDACPVGPDCAASREGRPDRYPLSRPRGKTTSVRVAVALVIGPEGVLLERGSERTPLRGEWDLPARELETPEDPGTTLARAILRMHGVRIAGGLPIGRASHAILDRRLRLEGWLFRTRRRRSGGEVRFVPAERMDEIPVSGATGKILRLFGDPPAHGRSQGNEPNEIGSDRGRSGSKGRKSA